MSSSDKSVATCFWRRVISQPDCPALCCQVDGFQAEDGTLPWLTWSQIAARVAACLQQLQNSHVAPGDHAISALANGLDWIAWDLACQTIGCVHVAVDHRLPVSIQEQLTEHSQASFHCRTLDSQDSDSRVSLSVAQHWLAAADEVSPNAAAQMLYTSGTIAQPKGVLLSHRSLLTNAQAKLSAAPQRSADLRLNLLPFAHAYARTCELSTWIISGCRLAIAEHWAQFLTLGQQLRPTLINLVPALAERLIQEFEADERRYGTFRDSLRLLQIGGAAVGDALFSRFSELGLPPLQGYGLTEAGPVVCSNLAGQQESGVVGPPVRGTQIRFDEDNVLWVRGPQVMLRYWRAPELTQQTIVDGWLNTGDLATRDEAGRIRILGRQSTQISLSNGLLVSPEEVECIFLRHPWIAQAVVVGKNQPRCHAWVWPHLQQLPDEFFMDENPSLTDRRDQLDEVRLSRCLSAWMADNLRHLPRYMCPEHIQILAEPLSVEAGTATVKGTPVRSSLESH